VAGGVGSLRLLSVNPPFRLLWVARAVSFLGDSLSLVALMLYIADTTGQALAVALLLLVGELAPALLSPLAGTVSDRFNLKRVMVCCELIQGALVAVTALWLPSLPLLLVLVGLRSLAGQVFQPASRAVVPALVRDDDLTSANAAIGVGTNAGEMLGPLTAALLLTALDVRGVLLVDAATFVISAAVLARLPAVPRQLRARPQVSFWVDTKEGLKFVATTSVVRTVVAGYFLVVAFNGIDGVALVFLVKDTLRGSDSAAGLLRRGRHWALPGLGAVVPARSTLISDHTSAWRLYCRQPRKSAHWIRLGTDRCVHHANNPWTRNRSHERRSKHPRATQCAA
jgi:MFS family permease